MRVYRLRERSRPSDDAAGLGQCGSAPDAPPRAKSRANHWSLSAGRSKLRRGRRRLAEQRMPPVVVAFPDCFTRLGGNQYINSASMGAWEDFLLHEMLPGIEQRFRCGGAGRRGVVRQKAPGYGAITRVAPLRHLVGCGLSFRRYGFRDLLCYLPDMPAVLRALASAENSIERWGSSSKQHFEQTEK